MRERRLILDQQLSQLEAERCSIEDGIQEINRRLAVLSEVEEWNLIPEQEDTAKYPATDHLENDAEEEIEWFRADPAILSQKGTVAAVSYLE